jgi:transcription elongation GreA/GreB family factor
VEAALLEDGADGARRLGALGVRRAADRRAAARRANQAEKDAQRRRLARAVGTEKARDRAGADLEREVVDGGRGRVALGQRVDVEDLSLQSAGH